MYEYKYEMPQETRHKLMKAINKDFHAVDYGDERMEQGYREALFNMFYLITCLKEPETILAPPKTNNPNAVVDYRYGD